MPGPHVVAEGPEACEQIAFLLAEGCDLVQICAVSRPIPEGDFARMLGEWAMAEP